MGASQPLMYITHDDKKVVLRVDFILSEKKRLLISLLILEENLDSIRLFCFLSHCRLYFTRVSIDIAACN